MNSKNFMNEEIKKEFIQLAHSFFEKHGFTHKEVIAFFASALVGTVHISGFTQKEFDYFCDVLKEEFRRVYKEEKDANIPT